MILYVCETCETYSEVSHHGQQGHRVTGMQGDDYEELTRTAAAHIVLARHIRKGWEDRNGLLAREMADARIHADWFSQEDADAYDAPGGGYKLDE